MTSPVSVRAVLLVAALGATVPTAVRSAPPDADDGGPCFAHPPTSSSHFAEPPFSRESEFRPSRQPRGAAELPRPAGADPAAILDQMGLEPLETCETFDSRRALRRRLERWRLAVRTLGRTHPDSVAAWITGTRRPPEPVLEEVRTMRSCMLDELFRAASDGNLVVELEIDGREIRSPTRARRWAQSYVDRTRSRRDIRRAATRSFYRSASEQAAIWRRKVRFLGPEFDAVGRRAARRCELDEGSPWDPGSERHARCWRSELTPRERVRQILSASAPPGLSRHHWGTEIDLFALTRSAFRPGRERHDEYRWLVRHARRWGFFQAYVRDAESYPPERWHWSYEPIAAALTSFARDNRAAIERELDEIWSHIERRHNREYPTELSFDYPRRNWQRYLFSTSNPPRW